MTGTDVEVVRVADDIRRGGEDLALDLRSLVLGEFHRLSVDTFGEGGFLGRLCREVPPTEVLDTVRWLARGIDFDDAGTRPFGMPPENYGFVLAALAEEAGDLEGALAGFEALKPELPVASVLHGHLDPAIERVRGKMERR